MLTIYFKEIKSFFFSIGGWIVLSYAALIQGICIAISIQAANLNNLENHLLYFAFHTPIFWFFFLFLFPLLTIRLFSEEEKTGTLQLLLSAPINSTRIILGKYLSSLTCYILLWTPGLLNFWLIDKFNPTSIIHFPLIISTYGMLILIGSFYLALGLLCSSCTANTMISGIIHIGILLPLFFSGYIPNIWGEFAAADFFRYIAPQYHLHYASQGSVSTSTIIYYLSATLFTLHLAKENLNLRHFK